MKYILATLILLSFAGAGMVHPQLAEKLANLDNNEPIAVIVHMKAQADLTMMPKGTTKAEKLLYLQEFAREHQAELLNYLRSQGNKIKNLRTFWIFNGMVLTTTKDIIEKIAQREDVDYVIDDFIVKIDTKIDPGQSQVDDTRTPEWNISKVSAPQCWNDGFDGTGIITGNIDTGCEVSHPAFHGRWVSGGWHDAVNGQPNPYDDHGHGTHTMGTICGGDGNGPDNNDVGVAPGANFICAKAFNSSGQGQSSWIHDALQWYAGQNVQVCSNSWGSSSTNTEFWNDCINLRNVGIYVVFATGNNGPGTGSATAPGNFPTVTGVGATDSGDNIASFSGRGPAPDQSPWNETQYWERPDWNRTKPDISAPGVNIRSSVPGGGYQGGWQGTSMATPHVAGAVTILLQKNPALDYNTIYNILLDNADHPSQGNPYPNNDYGWGRLNVYAALNAVPTGNMPNIILSRTQVVNDNNGNGILDPGESGGIVCYIKNNGQEPATNTTGTLRTTDTYITISDSTTNYGTIAAGDSADNSGDPFQVSVSSSCPVGHQVSFDLYVVCAESSWTRNFTLTIGEPGLDWVSHDCGNVKFTITRYGALGFMESDQINGDGFYYPISGANHLFYGGFAVGTDANYVVDRYYESGSDDTDWETTTSPDGMVRMQEPGPDNRDEYATAIYDDSNHPSPKGLVCEQYSWAWDDPTANDFVIMKFVLRNEGSTTINNLYAAVFMDWDIGNSSNNQGSSEAARNLTWMYESTPYVGVEILDPPRSTPAANLALIDHAQYVYPYSGLPDNIQIQFMDGSIQNSSSDRPYDWSTCNSVGPFTLVPGGAVVVAFAVLGGDNLSDLQANADTAYNRYWNWPGVEEQKPKAGLKRLRLSPVIASHSPFTIDYNLMNETQLNVEVYDVTGRLIINKNYGRVRGSGNVQLGLEQTAQGIYFIKLQAGNYICVEKVVWLK